MEHVSIESNLAPDPNSDSETKDACTYEGNVDESKCSDYVDNTSDDLKPVLSKDDDGVGLKSTKKRTSTKAPRRKGVPVKTRKYRRKCSTNAIRQIKSQQQSTDFAIKCAPFRRLVRSIAEKVKTDLRFSNEAMVAIQCAAEDFAIRSLKSAYRVSLSNKRQSLQRIDMKTMLSVLSDFNTSK